MYIVNYVKEFKYSRQWLYSLQQNGDRFFVGASTTIALSTITITSDSIENNVASLYFDVMSFFFLPAQRVLGYTVDNDEV